MMIWIVGLSGSGKSTLGLEIAKQLRIRHPNTVLLDGDDLRQVFKHDKRPNAFTVQGRRINAERMVALCQLIDNQGINVICCTLSIFPDIRKKNREIFKNYFEIFMDAPIDVLIKRDVKGIYAAGKRGEMNNIVGVDISFERPTDSDMIIDSSPEMYDISYLAKQVLSKARLI